MLSRHIYDSEIIVILSIVGCFIALGGLLISFYLLKKTISADKRVKYSIYFLLVIFTRPKNSDAVSENRKIN
jgi:hypothetical protein